MADKKISELPSGTTVYDADDFAIVQDGTTKQFNASAVRNYVNTGVVTLAGAQTLTNKTLTSPVISGGTANNVAIGGTTPAAGAFTTLSSTGNTTLGDASTDTVTVNGYMGIGAAGDSRSALKLSRTTTGGTSQFSIWANGTAGSDATTSFQHYYALGATTASAFTCAAFAGLRVDNSTAGAGSTITNQHGVLVNDLTSGTNNYGITSNVSSGTNKWNIYASGTANNYFAGNLGLGVTPSVWASSYKALQIGSTGSLLGASTEFIKIGSNYYYDGTSNKYITSGYASGYYQLSGSHVWQTTSSSGTAGNPITFINAMTLDASGNLLLNGTSTPTSAQGCLVIYNRNAAPTASISGGILYVESGALKYRGSSGTVTTIAPA